MKKMIAPLLLLSCLVACTPNIKKEEKAADGIAKGMVIDWNLGQVAHSRAKTRK